ncbi:hypothetical protein QPL79_07410 [Ignisphaera sp. 4213-co]|uniref:DUF2029 domain-containing protein n=1 Tax=Ignisphaera cupida TaxID=3050454 RepID=A0ABD4Z8C4_9CREN|nr:hypothetical protein [Ignisphaera sp. 4213-co]MDK6029188.1 hypothetical protein [Ignisphaera sp. 4213-co]
MAGFRIYYVFIAIVVASSLAFSIYIHFPYPLNRDVFGNTGFLYSDIVYGVFVPRFLDVVSPFGSLDDSKISGYWYSREVVLKLVSGNIDVFSCPAPYRDYKFEYPPLTALIWYFSTCTSFLYVYKFVGVPKNPLDYRSLVSNYVIPIHFAIQSAVLAVSAILMAIYMIRIAKAVGSSWSRVLIFFVLPSTVIYMIYNWDVLTASLVVIAVYELINERYGVGGALLGLATSAKLIPLFAVIAIGYDMLQKSLRKEIGYEKITSFATGFTLFGAAPYMVVAAFFSKGFSDFVNHHMTWYCENCLYLPIVHDIYNPIHRILFYTLATIFMLLVMTVEISNWRKLVEVSLQAIATGIVFNYIFSPQMILLITPLALLAIPKTLIAPYIFADAASASIILMFFKDQEIRQAIAKYVEIPVKFSPWTIDSPVQWVATIRNAILLAAYIIQLYLLIKQQSSE